MSRRRPSLPRRIKNIPVLSKLSASDANDFRCTDTPRRISESPLSKSPVFFVIRSGVVIMSVRVQRDENLIKKWAARAVFAADVLVIFKSTTASLDSFAFFVP